MNARQIIEAEAKKRRRKLSNGDIIDHPYFGRLVISSEILDRVPPVTRWQAFREDDGKPALPLFYSERGLHLGLKWYSRYTKPPYRFVT